MFEIGRICVKTAGRDAGKYCVVVEAHDDVFVTIDGQTRRKKCNIKHLEPTAKLVKVAKGAAHEAVVDALKKEGITVEEKKSTKPKKSAKTTEKKSVEKDK